MSGSVEPGFEPVWDVFRDLLVAGQGTGSAVAAWYDGRWVVDLWGGWADAGRTRRWTRDTIVMPYSVSKPYAAVCALVLVARGRLDLDASARRYWPQLRVDATVRQILSHSAGLVTLYRPAPTGAFFDWDDLCRRIAEQEPAWPPGEGVGESSLLYGHLVGELVRRVDGRSLGTFLREEVSGPLGLDFCVGVSDADLGRVADLTGAVPGGAGGPLHEAALANPPGATDLAVVNSRAFRRAEVPAINGHGTARAVAGLYVALTHGALLPTDLLTQLRSVQASGFDAVVGDHARWGLGVGIDDDGWGMGGLGGNLGWFSERGQYAFAFVTGDLGGFERATALENAVRAVLGRPAL